MTKPQAFSFCVIVTDGCMLLTISFIYYVFPQVTKGLDSNFSKSVLAILDSGKPPVHKSFKSVIDKQQITCIQENVIYTVKSEDDSSEVQNVYLVDVTSGMCTCIAGCTGSFCKHQYAVYTHYKIAYAHTCILRKFQKEEIFYVVTGHKAEPDLFPEDPFVLSIATPAPEYTPVTELTPPTSDSDPVASSSSSSSTSIQPTDFTAELKLVENRMNHFHEHIINRVSKNPETLLRPLNSFLCKNENMRTDTALATALSTYSNDVRPLLKCKGRYLPVGSITATRRKYYGDGCRRAQKTGRKPKGFLVMKNGVATQSPYLLPSHYNPKRAKKIHNLGRSIKKNATPAVKTKSNMS